MLIKKVFFQIIMLYRLGDVFSQRILICHKCYSFFQIQWIRDYDQELGKLHAEVDNIQAIKEALPDNCWKRLKLEP